MKVLTTYAALEVLGPAHTWQTRAYAAGTVRDQVLEGDLVLEGGGDPFMTADRWWGFVNGVRQAGIERIRGDVVIDNGYFAQQGDDRAAFDNRPTSRWTPPCASTAGPAGAAPAAWSSRCPTARTAPG
jgi:D-alanyl-D-alanine carboxypeptidase/D-alanyl-D-alanine-endopeptidase (penicillin-binding protein 4)